MNLLEVMILTFIIQNTYLSLGLFLDLVVYRDRSLSLLEGAIEYFMTRKVAEELLYAFFYTIFGGTLVTLWKTYWSSNHLGFVIYDMTALDPVIKYSFLVIFADFVYYLGHRLSHSINLLWAGHKFHHTIKVFHTAFVSLRLSPELAFYMFPAFMPMLFGFSIEETVVGATFVMGWDFLVHSQRVPKLNWLVERIFVTPSNHRVHHSKQVKYIDKNFAVMFVFWDVIFGSFMEEGDDVRIGLYGMRKRKSYIARYFTGYIDLWEDFTKVMGLKDKLTVLFSSPMKVKVLLDRKYSGAVETVSARNLIVRNTYLSLVVLFTLIAILQIVC